MLWQIQMETRSCNSYSLLSPPLKELYLTFPFWHFWQLGVH